ncbi:hypothetical protein [Streptomyces sp. NRRL S-350]|uniref:hypothetical protein n=1 Tax=Streptomyces sp. NRRL S-350 TaxID=1463902 RepID=UPI000AA2DA63|nr:hypothetical protein [Streptomyces sp. NRRL S-350]
MSTTTTIKSCTELDELGKFFTITARRLDAGEAAPEMFSAAIDTAWHQLATDPAAHGTFAVQYANRKLVHVESAGAGFISWVSAYEEVYGPLPETWFTDAAGSVDTESLARYRETGEVWAEWNCSPAPGDGDDLTATATNR